MAGSFSRYPGLRNLSSASHDDLKTIITRLVDKGHVSAEVVNGELESIRGTTGEMVRLVSESMMPLSIEQTEVKVGGYKSQYEKLDEMLKSDCTWEEVESRLLANDGHYLRLANRLFQGGVLFGLDEQGNPLFADGGVEPVMTGMNYSDTRKKVLYKYDGEDIRIANGKPVPTGYELFPHSSEDKSGKSREIKMFEAVTGKLFVQSPEIDVWRSVWLESGENPTQAMNATFYPINNHIIVSGCNPKSCDQERGVRRMLRVEKNPNLLYKTLR